MKSMHCKAVYKNGEKPILVTLSKLLDLSKLEMLRHLTYMNQRNLLFT